MGKKRIRKVYTSKGIHSAVSNATTRAVRLVKPAFDKALDVVKAWKIGKNPWVTIKNPDARQTNMPFIKVRANTYYGDHKKSANLFKGGGEA